MRSFRCALYFTLGVMIALTWGLRSAIAEVMYPTPAGIIPTEVLGPSSVYPRLAGTAVSTAAVAEGVAVTAAGTAAVVAGAKTLSVPVSVVATVSKARIVAAVTGCASAAALNPIGAVACAGTIASVAQALKGAGLGYGPCPTGSAQAYAFVCKAEQPGIAGDPVGMGYYYNSNIDTMAKTPADACNKLGDGWYNSQPAGDRAQMTMHASSVDSSYRCTFRIAYNGGSPQTVYGNVTVSKYSDYYVPATLPPSLPEFTADVDKAVTAKPSLNKDWYDGIQADYRNNPTTFPQSANPIQADTPVTVNAPVTETAPFTTGTTTTPKADGSTDTTTTTTKERVTPTVSGNTMSTTNITYNTSTITNNTTTNSVTGGSTVTTTTTNRDPAAASPSTPSQDDYSFVDKSMPDQPKLYTQKYPDGIAGAWRDNKPDVSATPFFQGIKGMFPTFGAGSCPSFSLPLTIGHLLGAGTVPFNVPCSIYQFIGLVMLVTAAFTARKIIF